MPDREERLSQEDMELLRKALNDSELGSEFSDEDFAVVAEYGLSAIPEDHQEQMMIRLCQGDEVAEAVLSVSQLLHSTPLDQPRLATEDTRMSDHLPSSRAKSRNLLAGLWAVAACLTLFSGAMLFSPEPASFDPDYSLREFSGFSLTDPSDMQEAVGVAMSALEEARVSHSRIVNHRNEQRVWKMTAIGAFVSLNLISIIALMSIPASRSVESTR